MLCEVDNTLKRVKQIANTLQLPQNQCQILSRKHLVRLVLQPIIFPHPVLFVSL
jgi:hypothetical protein